MESMLRTHDTWRPLLMQIVHKIRPIVRLLCTTTDSHRGDQLDRVRGVPEVIDSTRNPACIVSLEVDIPGAVHYIHGLQICGLKR